MTQARWCVARRCGRCLNCCRRMHSPCRPVEPLRSPTQSCGANGGIALRALDFIGKIPPQSPAMKKEPFFARQGDAYIPNPVSNGPWNPDSMHGRVVIGLLAHAIEEQHGSPDFVPARLTVDMFRLPDIHTPVKVTTKRIRDGMRIRLVEAEFFSGDTSMARAS